MAHEAIFLLQIFYEKLIKRSDIERVRWAHFSFCNFLLMVEREINGFFIASLTYLEFLRSYAFLL